MDQRVVNAASIGFIPGQFERNQFGGRDYLSWEWIETSLVPIPANSEAVRMLKGLGLWGDDEPVIEIADEERYIEVDDALYRQAMATVARHQQRPFNAAAQAGLLGESGAHHDYFAVDEAELRAVVSSVVRSSLREITADAVRRELRRIQGRVD